MKNFAVSGMGRSGTTWLSHTLNQSPTWSVSHEPRPKMVTDLRTVQRRFDRDYYGEVNSLIRYILLDLDVNRKAVIVRHPQEILQSMYNRVSSSISKSVARLSKALRLLDEIVSAGVMPISFARMTTDEAYLRQVAGYLGVVDLPGEIDFTPRNGSRDRAPVDPHVVEDNFGWFIDKYEGHWTCD